MDFYRYDGKAWPLTPHFRNAECLVMRPGDGPDEYQGPWYRVYHKGRWRLVLPTLVQAVFVYELDFEVLALCNSLLERRHEVSLGFLDLSLRQKDALYRAPEDWRCTNLTSLQRDLGMLQRPGMPGVEEIFCVSSWIVGMIHNAERLVPRRPQESAQLPRRRSAS